MTHINWTKHELSLLRYAMERLAFEAEQRGVPHHAEDKIIKRIDEELRE